MSAGVLKYTLIRRHPETDVPTALLAGEPVPAWAAKLVHADDLEGGDAAGDEEKGYADQKVDQLKQLIADRNEGRDEEDLIPDEGKKADLVAALEADDAAHADDE